MSVDYMQITLIFLNPSGNLVIESKPAPGYTPNVVVGQVPPGTNHISKTPGQINLAQLRLQHMQQQVYAQKHQQLQQMRMQQPPAPVPTTTTATQQHSRQAAPQMLQQQVSATSHYWYKPGRPQVCMCSVLYRWGTHFRVTDGDRDQGAELKGQFKHFLWIWQGCGGCMRNKKS